MNEQQNKSDAPIEAMLREWGAQKAVQREPGMSMTPQRQSKMSWWIAAAMTSVAAAAVWVAMLSIQVEGTAEYSAVRESALSPREPVPVAGVDQAIYDEVIAQVAWLKERNATLWETLMDAVTEIDGRDQAAKLLESQITERDQAAKLLESQIALLKKKSGLLAKEQAEWTEATASLARERKQMSALQTKYAALKQKLEVQELAVAQEKKLARAMYFRVSMQGASGIAGICKTITSRRLIERGEQWKSKTKSESERNRLTRIQVILTKAALLDVKDRRGVRAFSAQLRRDGLAEATADWASTARGELRAYYQEVAYVVDALCMVGKCDCGKDHFTELVRVFVGGEVVPAPTRCRNEGFAKV
jgi:hypothetical protein